MIITKQKELKEILGHLEGQNKVFLVGCGECSTTCKTGGEAEVRSIKEALEKKGMKSLRYDAMDKVRQGLTSLDEAIVATMEDS